VDETDSGAYPMAVFALSDFECSTVYPGNKCLMLHPVV
jgi:hypothetical protein